MAPATTTQVDWNSIFRTATTGSFGGTTTSGSYADLSGSPTDNVSVIVPASGKIDIRFSGVVWNNSAGQFSWMSVVLSGANSISAGSIVLAVDKQAVTGEKTISYVFEGVGLTPGLTNIKCKWSVGGGTATWSNSRLSAQPIL